ncbi:MAG: sulfur carrier protein ThiS [Clostridia bacterium]|nr:sulfur carrier protein ThiS [Clostridia bacterium]MBR2878093.1 sulfur carrier protein ThiS [Clostridia bacterium]MBR2973004.1 sulfur carrier protein ThiS [Clostridia bacterium]MBR3576274.1 sulfur carrier protein ThiS [Clostridia bacterium]
MVKVNGKQQDIAGKSVAEYLISADYDIKRVAVELNGDILPKTKYEETILKNGDSAEVVSFVGGG